MDARQLRSFLAVVETLHFGRAAASLGISQPALSQQIRRLEADLGVSLFERTNRRVALTDGGRALIVGARRVLADIDRAEQQCRDAAEGAAGHLTMASVGAALNSLVPPIVASLRRRVPGIAIELQQMDTPVQLEALRDGRLDVGITRSARPSPGLEIRRLIEEPMVVVVPSDNPLAANAVVEPAQLRNESFILWPRSGSEAFHDQVIGVCQQAGFSPRVVMEGADIETQLGLVSAGVGVSLQPASFAALGREGVSFLALPPDAPRSELQLAWPTFTASPTTGRFLEVAAEVAAAHGDVLAVGPYANHGLRAVREPSGRR